MTVSRVSRVLAFAIGLSLLCTACGDDDVFPVQPSAAEQSCLASGGTTSTAMCCGNTNDFPNTCAIGACGCGPTASHEVRVCNCGTGKCFDGTACVTP